MEVARFPSERIPTVFHPQEVQDSPPTLPARIGRCARTAGGLAFTGALLLGGAGLAAADPVGGDDLETTSITESSQDDATGYWTADRMESATPADALVDGNKAPDGQVESSGTVTIPSVAGTPQPDEAPQEQTATTDGERNAVAADTDHIGKVFFTVGGQDYVCSGDSVASTNGSTVSTAGHCVNDAGTWASNWVFAPGYDNGETPYGLWSASDLFSTDQWVSGEDMNYDVAFAVVEPESGTAALTDAVGGSGVEFNTARGGLYTSFGYPAASPFDGESLEQCQDTGSDDTLGGTDDQAIDCDMTGGSSGGPWFAGDGASGPQISVNSFGYTSQPNVMYGPYLGDVAQQVYQEASAS